MSKIVYVIEVMTSKGQPYKEPCYWVGHSQWEPAGRLGAPITCNTKRMAKLWANDVDLGGRKWRIVPATFGGPRSPTTTVSSIYKEERDVLVTRDPGIPSKGFDVWDASFPPRWDGGHSRWHSPVGAIARVWDEEFLKERYQGMVGGEEGWPIEARFAM